MRSKNISTVIRPFLKWAGNKFRLITAIQDRLPSGQRLIEPFTGSGAVFLNTEYPYYLLNDINPDLIFLYKTLQKRGKKFVTEVKALFTPESNTEKHYYSLRDRFNQLGPCAERSALFIYLNRHCYNGLCRYNSQGQFNVPFGLYKKPYCPEEEMLIFSEKSKRAEFVCHDFKSIIEASNLGDVIYCDPPYLPLSETAYFTNYSGNYFTHEQQINLASLAEATAKRGIPILLSNHDTPISRKLYHRAKIHSFPVRRSISCQGNNRLPAQELLALFGKGS